MRHRWTASEITLLLQYPDSGLETADRLPGRTDHAITNQAKKLGLRSKDRFRRFRKTIPVSEQSC